MLCVWASINEKGKTIGGKLGDQTSREVRKGGYYNFGQSYCIRPRRETIAARIAACAIEIADNENIGYDQENRETLFDAFKNNNWKNFFIDDLCSTDCSMLAICCANFALESEVFPKTLYSGNIVPVMTRNSNFVKMTIGKNFVPSKGDIIVAPGKHVIIVVDSEYIGTPIEKPLYMAGKTYMLDANMKVRSGAGVKSAWKKRVELTTDGFEHSQEREEAVLVKGTKVTCRNIIEIGSDIWMEIPSGYVAAFYQGVRYVINCDFL